MIDDIGDKTLPVFIEDIAATHLDNDNKGAYYVLDTQLPKVVIYASPSSAFSAPVYGNLMLQKILRQQTGNDNINLTFSDEPLKLSVYVYNLAGSETYGSFNSFFMTFVALMAYSAVTFASR